MTKALNHNEQPTKMGRPCEYTDEVADEILERISLGESLNMICKDKHLPAHSTIYKWLADEVNANFSDNYTLARARQADFYADEIITIADDGSRDTIIRVNRKGEPYESPDHDHINRSRLMVDTRKFVMRCLAPKKYGERVQVDATLDIHVKEISWDTDKPGQLKTSPTASLPRIKVENTALPTATKAPYQL